jgi:hypothetical protein
MTLAFEGTILLVPLPPPLGLGLSPLLPIAAHLSAEMRLSHNLSVFDIVNYFHSRWFLSRDWLLTFVATAQRTTGGAIDWVEFTPKGHTHLVQCAFKLVPPTPLIPAAKVKRCMFVFILDILNGTHSSRDFFAPTLAPSRRPCQRTPKPQGSGLDPPAADGQDLPPLGVMDLDAPCIAGDHRPTELSGPSGLASLPSTLVEEQDPVTIYSALASTSVGSLGFPPPSASSAPSRPPTPHSLSLELDSSTLDVVVAQALSLGGAFGPPSPSSLVIGKCSRSSSLSPPESSASPAPCGFVYTPTLPPPPIGTWSQHLAPNWREWIWACHWAASGHSWVDPRNVVARADDLVAAAAELATFEVEPLPPQDWDRDPLASPSSF